MSSMDELIRALKTAPTDEDVASGLKVAEALRTRVATEAIVVSPTARSRQTLIRPTIVAMVVIVAIVAAINLGGSRTAPTTAPFAQAYSTTAGQRASIKLADGSRVVLGPLTTLRIGQQSDKSVSLDITGEALFTVNHSAARGFTVSAHGVTTRVLGTDFVVRAYDATRVRVAVREGRVSVQSPSLTSSNAVIVNANQAASVSADGVPSVTTIEDISTDFAWANGTLVLRNVTVGEAFMRLSRWYGIELKASDPKLLSLYVDASFPAGYNPGLIRDMAGVVGANADIKGKTITFSPQQKSR